MNQQTEMNNENRLQKRLSIFRQYHHWFLFSFPDQWYLTLHIFFPTKLYNSYFSGSQIKWLVLFYLHKVDQKYE